MNAASFWAGREDQARNGDPDYPDVSGGGVPYSPQPVSAREAGAAPGQAAYAYAVGDQVQVTGTVIAVNSRADWVSVRADGGDGGGGIFAVDGASASPHISRAVTAAAAAQAAPTMFATEALVRFADDGQWLTCTEDGTLDMRAELLAVKHAVREVLDAAARPKPKAPQPAPGELLSNRFFHLASELENEADQLMHEGGSGWISRLEVAARVRAALDTEDDAEQPAPELAALREQLAELRDRLTASANATRPSRKTQIEDEITAAVSALLEGK